MAVAMSGLFAYGLLKMDGLLGYNGWQWVFLIEGAPSLLLGAICWVRPDLLS
jgi:ACS family tartrate transporter-like MFS transporter